MSPLQLLSPRFVAKPVANVVHIPCIDKDLDTVSQHVREHLLVGLHPVTLECHVDDAVAALPLLSTDPQLLLHICRVQKALHLTHVIAKRRDRALDAHVIGVVTGGLVWDQLTVVADCIGCGASTAVRPGVAGFDEAHARHCCCLHGSLRQEVGNHTLLQCAPFCLSTILGHLWIPLVLFLRIDETVANANPLQGHLETTHRLGLLPKEVGDGRHIVPCVGLTKQVEVPACVLREGLVEALHELVHIARHALLIMSGGQASGKSRCGWLVNIDDIGMSIPAVLVQLGCLAVLVHSARAVLGEES
mmetsp:Transcript_58477/g.130731  ORF Transcript_58477/g.130731 Transcript_58477/m.130731 type:complete len:304 (+) Transcript_58477:273-1184(+)